MNSGDDVVTIMIVDHREVICINKDGTPNMWRC